MTTDEMIPIVTELDEVGYHSLEAWGGATFDSCMRFLNEDPWERLRKFKNAAKKTPLQMLFRGQNILGYRHYADDVVEYFVQKSVANGIDILRIFDALNDIRNFQTAIKAAKKEKAHVQAAVSYTISPAHSNQSFIDLAVREEMGADSICIKDMAGLLTPSLRITLLKTLKPMLNTAAASYTLYQRKIKTYIKAIKQVSMLLTVPFAFCHGYVWPPTEPLVAALKGTKYDTGIDLERVSRISDILNRFVKSICSRDYWI